MLPRKQIMYMDVDKAETFQVPQNSEDKIKVSISGQYEEFKTFKKTKKYKELINNGVKVVFKPKRSEKKAKEEDLSKLIEVSQGTNNFNEILCSIVTSSKDAYLFEVYEEVINDNLVKSDDIVFL